MKKITPLLLILLLSSSAFATDDVEELLMDHCTSCHTDSIYTRAESIVHNKMELEKTLHRCNHAAGTQWDPQTVTRVMDYLNQHYYKF